MGSELGSLIKASAVVWAALSYARLASARLRPGAPRLAGLIPVVALFYGIPFSFTTTFRGAAAFFLCWLGFFKLLLLAAGRGPLDPTLPLHHFVFSASLPVKLRQSTSSKAKNLLLAAVHAVIHEVLGMEMEPQVDRPYLASSLRDFWGRRWNLMVPAILRPSVYGPVSARHGVAAGVLAAFLVSGLMHEVIFFYIMWRPPSGEVTAFFLLHGACTAAEAWWARHAGWWRPPRAAAVPLTLAFVAGTAFWLFFPAMIKGGLDELVLQECQGMVVVMEQAVRRLAGATDLSISTR